MAQYIIDIGAVPDDGQGDPLRTAFDYTNENFNQIFAAGPVLSNIQIGNNTITTTVLNSNLILSPSGIGRIQLNNTLFPRLNDVYDIGTPSLRFNSIYLGTGGIDTTGGITTTGNITAGYFIGNGSQLTGIVATTGSQVVNGNTVLDIPAPGSNIFVTVNGTSNVVSFADSGVYVAGKVSATGNIAGNYILGNGALLTGINIGYGNSNVADFLPTYTGNLVSLTGPVTTTANVTGGNIRTAGQIIAAGNITGGNVSTGRLNAGYITVGTTISAIGNIATNSYFIGDGSLLTGINANYSNANVAAFLPTYTGNLVSLTGPVTTTANITGGNLRTTGTILASGNITAANLDTSRVNAANITASGSISAVANITTSGYFIGDGSQLTNLPAGNYSNANVAAFLPTYTGSIPSLTGLLRTTSNIIGGNISTAGQISAVGNITGGNIDGSRVNANVVTVNSTISAAGTITGNNLVGATVTGTTVTAIANVVGGNVVTGGQVSAVGNIQGGNLNAPGGAVTSYIVSATGRVQGGNFVTTGFITATGNITGGNVDTGNIHAGNVNVDGNVSAQYYSGNGRNLTGIVASGGSSIDFGNSNVKITTADGNVSVNIDNTSDVAVFATTGEYVTGIISATGNILGNGFLSDHYYYANGTPVPFGIVYTANIAPPSTPSIADQWYDTTNDVLYEYISDGISTYWVDTTSPAFAGGVVANVVISGNMLPVANVTFNIGNASAYFNTAFLQTASVAGNVVAGRIRSDTVVASVLANTTAINLQTNGTNALSVDSNQYITTYRRFAASSMPVGSVVQTVMSSSLGGSITNSTSYVDVSFATVTITPSSVTSRIVILATGTSNFTSVAGANVVVDTQLVRSPSISLQVQNYGSNITGGGIGGAGSIAYSYQDSPGTTSAVTYKLQQRISNASSTLTSTNIWLIAMEIAA